MTKDYRDKEMLKSLYWKEGLSFREIGEEFGVSGKAIEYWFNKHNLKRRGVGGEHPYKVPFKTLHESSDSSGYEAWRIKIKGKQYEVKVHRLLAVAEYGIDKVKENHIHHINNIKWDNRSENIKLVTSGEHGEIHKDNLKNVPVWESYRCNNSQCPENGSVILTNEEKVPNVCPYCGKNNCLSQQ